MSRRLCVHLPRKHIPRQLHPSRDPRLPRKMPLHLPQRQLKMPHSPPRLRPWKTHRTRAQQPLRLSPRPKRNYRRAIPLLHLHTLSRHIHRPSKWPIRMPLQALRLHSHLAGRSKRQAHWATSTQTSWSPPMRLQQTQNLPKHRHRLLLIPNKFTWISPSRL